MVWQWDRTPDKFLSVANTMNALKSNFPGIIVAPISEKDLRSSLDFARQYRIRVVTRCSGSDYNGRSTGRGVMMIRTERMNYVEYDPDSETIFFNAGATTDAINSALADWGRLFVGPQGAAVCPAGCLAGGCHGILSRQFGLGIDSILEIQIMLFNGTMVTATRDCYPDLFHAYLGAGQNTFGVAYAFRAQTYPAPPQILKLQTSFSVLNPNLGGATYPNLFSEYIFNVKAFNSLPNELSANVMSDGYGNVQITFFYTGTDSIGAFNAIQPLLNSPYRQTMDPITTYSTMAEAVRDNQTPIEQLWSRTFIGNAFIPPQQSLLNNVSRLIGASPPPMMLWMAFGGAVRTGSTGSVPSGMRSAMYEAVFGDRWYDPVEDEGRMAGVNNDYLQVLYSIGNTSYNNEYTTWGNLYNVLPDWKTRFFNNYNGLLLVKQRYDPCNVFTVKFGVGNDLPQATC